MGYTPPQLEVRKVTGGYEIFPPNAVTTEDLVIHPNTTDTYSWLKLYGNSAVEICFAGTTYFQIKSTTDSVFKVSYSTPDTIVENPTNDKNLFLKTNGTGVLKFGTYTAGAATDSTGYITIQDAAGNTRKLMVQA